MYSRNQRKQQNPVERAMRPGVLFLSVLIGLAIVYLLSPTPLPGQGGSDGHIAVAEGGDGAEIDYEDASGPEDFEDADTYEDPDRYDRTSQAGDSESDPGEGQTSDSAESYPDTEPLPGDDEASDGAGDETAPAEDTPVADKEGRHRECIYVRSIDEFHVIDDKHLTVSTSPRRIYLLTLWNRCRQLNWTHRIAIKSHGSWTCSYSRDVIIADNDRCIIDDIERVGSVEEAESLVAERIGD